MLSIDMDEVLEVLPLEDDVMLALKGEGELAELLELATSYEHGDWDKTAVHLGQLNLEIIEAELLYIRSRNWAQQMLGFSKSVE